MKNEIEFIIEHSQDKQFVKFSVKRDGETVAIAPLTGSDAEALILKISNHRSSLADAVPMKLDPNSRLGGDICTTWFVHTSNEQIGLGLRSPGLGWIGFLLTPEQSAALGQDLLAQGRQVPSEQLANKPEASSDSIGFRPGRSNVDRNQFLAAKGSLALFWAQASLGITIQLRSPDSLDCSIEESIDKLEADSKQLVESFQLTNAEQLELLVEVKMHCSNLRELLQNHNGLWRFSA